MLVFIAIALLLLIISLFLFNRFHFPVKAFPSIALQGVDHAETSSVFFSAAEKELVYVSQGPAKDKADELAMEIDDLEWMLEKKRTELEEIRQDKKLFRAVAAQVDMIEDAVNAIEAKIYTCQQQMGAYKTVAMELDELEINYQQLKNELAQSQHNYQDILQDNESLREQLEMAEEDLDAERKEKQKLQKKLIILESLNQDLQSMVDALKSRTSV